MSAIRTLAERVYAGRRELYDLSGIDPENKNTEVIISVDLHMRIMSELADRDKNDPLAVWKDVSAPSHLRVFGFPVRRDPTFADDEIRFRTEVVL